MKTFLICFVLAILSFWGYAYSKNPNGCKKVGKDFVVLVQSLLPSGTKQPMNPGDAPEVKEALAAIEPTVSRKAVSVTPTIVAPTYTPPAPIKGWAPPNPLPAQARWTWTTTWGKTYEDVVITKVEPDLVSITHSLGAASIPISTLPPELQKQLNYDPAMASVIGSATYGKLINPDGTPWTSNAPIKNYAVYFSAHWCPPCRLFTPKLVEWYKAFKPTHPDFELIFVSSDEDAALMAEYRKSTGMTFPAVRFDAIASSGLKKYCGPGIPCLVLMKASGEVILDSYDHGNYTGPYQVMDGIPKAIGD